MTQTPTQPQARAKVRIPAAHPMVMLLGSGDSLLRVIETAFPAADIHVRGNEISAIGDAVIRPDPALVRRDDARAPHRAADDGGRSGTLDRHAPGERQRSGGAAGRDSRRGAHPEHPFQSWSHDPPQDAQPEALRGRDRQAHDRLRHRTRDPKKSQKTICHMKLWGVGVPVDMAFIKSSSDSSMYGAGRENAAPNIPQNVGDGACSYQKGTTGKPSGSFRPKKTAASCCRKRRRASSSTRTSSTDLKMHIAADKSVRCIKSGLLHIDEETLMWKRSSLAMNYAPRLRHAH